MEVLVTSVQHGVALKPLKSLELPVEIVAVEIIYLHPQNDAKFLPFARKTAFPKERPFFCGTAFFEIFQIIIIILQRRHCPTKRRHCPTKRRHYNGVFFAQKDFSLQERPKFLPFGATAEKSTSTLHVRGTRFMVRAMSELQKDELVKTYEYIYDFELAESMASNSTRLDWGVTNRAAKKHRGVFCASKFRSSLYPTIPLNTHTNPG